MRYLPLIGAVLFAGQNLLGQGGPPMITDDPGTPGDRKWEINLSLAFEHRNGETSIDSPGIDLNYGVGEHVQLTLQGGPTILKRSGQGLIAGPGGTEAAVKWRFADEETSGLDVSMFPRVIFNVAQSSVRRGLSEDGTRFQVPFQLARKLGPFAVDAEVGPLTSTVGRSEWLYGIVAGYDLNDSTTALAEIHGSSRMNFTQDVLALNFGLRHELSKTHVLIGSIGHEVRSSSEPRALIGYFGMQLLY